MCEGQRGDEAGLQTGVGPGARRGAPVHHRPADQVTPAVDSEAISYELYFREYESRFLYISQIEERAVLKETGCLPPCELSSFEC